MIVELGRSVNEFVRGSDSLAGVRTLFGPAPYRPCVILVPCSPNAASSRSHALLEAAMSSRSDVSVAAL